MEILRKIIDCKSLENPQGNFYGGVSFSKVTSLVFRQQLCYKENLPQILFQKYTEN